MQRFHRNTTVLIFTCLIRRSDGSQMSNLISVVGFVRLMILPSDHFSCCLFSCPCAPPPLHLFQGKTSPGIFSLSVSSPTWRRGESIGNQSAVSSPAALLVDPLTLLVLIPLVIFLLLLFPWLAASYGVEKKGEDANRKEKTGGERNISWSPCKIYLIHIKFRFLASVYSQISFYVIVDAFNLRK
jgi:hypothetical protein